MPVTNHQKYTQGTLVFNEVRKRETNDKVTGNIIKYIQVILKYDHPMKGSHVRSTPNFELCQASTPTGLIKEGNKLSSFTVFDIEDEEVRACVDIKERTQIRGWLARDDNIEIDMGIKGCKAKALKSVKIYLSPDKGSEKIGNVEKDTVMVVENQSDDDQWLQVKTGGQDGFLTQMYNDVAAIVFENRVACGLANLENITDVRSKMKSPVYWHRNKEGNFVEGKNPSTYFKYTYFGPMPPKGDKPASKERYVNFNVPGMEEPLALDVLLNSAITFRPVVTLTNVYIGAGKITPQFYVTSGVVTDIKKIERMHQQQETINKYQQDKDLVEKLRKQVENSLGFITERKEEQEAIVVPQSSPTSNDEKPDLEAMLSGGPRLEKANLNGSGGDDDDLPDIDIPGLPTL